MALEIAAEEPMRSGSDRWAELQSICQTAENEGVCPPFPCAIVLAFCLCPGGVPEKPKALILESVPSIPLKSAAYPQIRHRCRVCSPQGGTRRAPEGQHVSWLM